MTLGLELVAAACNRDENRRHTAHLTPPSIGIRMLHFQGGCAQHLPIDCLNGCVCLHVASTLLRRPACCMLPLLVGR